MQTRLIVSVTFAMILILSAGAAAHRPLFTNSDTSDPESALRVPNPSTSHVIYAELTESDPVQWFVFEIEKPQEIPILIGVPAGISPDDFRPGVVLLGPGWSEPPREFTLPPSIEDGARVITIRSGENAEPFYEPITGTKSQIFVETKVQFEEVGTYYGAIYEADGQEGKLWVGIGKSEGFSWRDALRLPGWIRDVRQFHEVSGWPPWAYIATLSLLAIVLGAFAWMRLRRCRERSKKFG